MKDIKYELINRLMRLGLTNYESKAYLVIAQRGAATASEIAKVTGIPPSKIHYVLKRLEDRGLIECQNGRPRVYKIVNPEVGLTSLLRRYEADKEKAMELIRDLMSSRSTELRFTKGSFCIVRGLHNILKKLTGSLTLTNGVLQ